MPRTVYVEPRHRGEEEYDIELVISGTMIDYNAFDAAGQPVGSQRVKVSVETGTYVGSSVVTEPAFRFGVFDEGSSLRLVNSGTIEGKGGDAGEGGQSAWFGNNVIGGGGGGGAGYYPGAGGCSVDYSLYPAQSGTDGTITQSGTGANDLDLGTLISPDNILPGHGQHGGAAVEFSTSGTLLNYGIIAGGGGGGGGSPGVFCDQERGGHGGVLGGAGKATTAAGGVVASGGLAGPAITTSGAEFTLINAGTILGNTVTSWP